MTRSGRFVERARIPIPRGQRPGFDHADIHVTSQRVYVAHTGADRIAVLDCEAASYRHALEDHAGVAGILIDQASGLLVSSDRGCARVSLWQLPAETLLGRVSVDWHPNGLAYDPGRRRLFVFCLGDPPGHGPTLVIVDIERLRVVGRLPLPGRPRWALYDPTSDRVFANIADPSQILVIDAEQLRLDGALDVPRAGPHGLALHADDLFCACDGGALVMLDRAGHVRGQAPLPGVPDVIWHDPLRGHVLVAIGDPGCVCVIEVSAQSLVETIVTGPGAHTTAWNPSTRTLYAFLPETCEAVSYSEEVPS